MTIACSGYVLKRGLEQNREHFDLLLHCILIVTSVIPTGHTLDRLPHGSIIAELNMQLALAVNNSLLTLMRLHVFCTEPFRVPLAGRITACLFDKTGTITTDELVAAGTIAPPQGHTAAVQLRSES